MSDEYRDISGRGGTQWATFDEGAGHTEEKDLHVKGTMRKSGGRYAFMMFNPEIPQDRDRCRVRCGMCHQPMDGFKSCRNCYPWRQEGVPSGNDNLG